MELSSPYLKMVRCLFLSIFYSPKKLKKMLTLHYTAWEKILIVVCRYKLGLYKWINSTGKISKKCKHGSLLCKDIILRWIRRLFFAQLFCFGEIVLKRFCFSCAPVRAGIEDENTTTCHHYNIPLQPLLCAYNKNWSCVSSLIAIVLVYCDKIN